MNSNAITIPISRWKRELRKWTRFISKNPEEMLYISENGVVRWVMVEEARIQKAKEWADEMYEWLNSPPVGEELI